jgi:uncharacterized protein
MAVYFEIQADDPARAIKFYSAVLGWKFFEVKGLLVAYWTIDTGTAPGGGLLQRPAKAPPAGSGTNAFVCSFEVVDVDAAQKKILMSGGAVALRNSKCPANAGRATSLTRKETRSVFFNRFNH